MVPVTQVLDHRVIRRSGNACRVQQHLAQRHAFLAPDTELRRKTTAPSRASGFLLSRAAKDPAPLLTLGRTVAAAVERALTAAAG